MSIDPFAEDDPQARERERRRAEREAQRRAGAQRRSLGDRVSGALDEAAGRRASDDRGRRVVPRPAPAGPGPGGATGAGGAEIWRRRLLAIGALLLLGVAAAALFVTTRDEEPLPVPKGPATLKTVSVTIPEGYTREEMAKVAEDAGLKGDYEKATAQAPKGFDLAATGAPADATLEGFLYPATYELEKGAPVSDLVDKQLTEGFEPNFGRVDMSYAKRKNLTVYDVVTIASMIEREVQIPEERPLVAAVIYNRLADGEPLGIDATLRYEVGFDKPLTESQLEMESPYNTRTNPGLPPTPIGNPGFDSLKAAAKPASVDYKYYVIKPGTCNEHTFTADYDEFLAAQADYQAALEEQGGSPTDC